MTDKTKTIIKTFIKVGVGTIVAVLTAFLTLISLNSCNVTRKITTESSFFQRGDTTTTITTKTIESYDATKKLQ